MLHKGLRPLTESDLQRVIPVSRIQTDSSFRTPEQRESSEKEYRTSDDQLDLEQENRGSVVGPQDIRFLNPLWTRNITIGGCLPLSSTLTLLLSVHFFINRSILRETVPYGVKLDLFLEFIDNTYTIERLRIRPMSLDILH